MNCPTCSAPIAATDDVCRACGTDLSMAGSPRQLPPPGSGGYERGGIPEEARNWALGAHLGGLVLGLASAAVFGFIVPLLVWLLKRDEHPFVEHHAKESLNFQLTVLTAVVAAFILAIPAVIVGVLTLGVGLVVAGLILFAGLVLWFVLPVIASVKAANGEGYRYPLAIRYVK